MRRALTVSALFGLVAAVAVVPDVRADPVPIGGVVTEQDYRCGRGDLPETGIQGDVPLDDQSSGRAERGYNCGVALVGHTTLGARGRTPDDNANMAWVDDCAYITGPGAVFGEPSPAYGDGVAVVDVSNAARPRHVRTLRSPGAVAALETIHAAKAGKRAILVVGQYGNQAGGNKPMDVYDVSDCANPRLLETFIWPENIHNLTITGNGRYVFATQPLQVVDIGPLFDRNPRTGTRYLGNLEEATPGPPFAVGPTADLDDPLPEELRNATRSFYLSHEAWPSADGRKLYLGGQLPVFETLSILDIGQWLKRDRNGNPLGPPKVISQRSGRGHSVRTATIGPRRFLLHSEESILAPSWGCLPETPNPFAGPAQPWLTDITNERDPVLVSQFGLEINDPENCPAVIESNVHSAVHYHDVDDPQRTTFAMVSMWNSGVRIFDVRNPARPTEIAYFNPGDVDPSDDVRLDHAWGHVRWVSEKGQIWFATASGGFWVVELEPQVRRRLGLRSMTVRHPNGRAGTSGVRADLRLLSPVSTTAWSCAVPVV